jgi:hypothetical protein
VSKKLITIPEYILLDHVEKAIKYLRDDYAAQTDPDKSYLRRVLYDNRIQRYDLIEQAESVFIQEIDNPRYLEVDLMWNMQRDGLPTIHITLPSEQTHVGGNGIGTDEGYRENIFEESVYDEETNELITQGSITPIYTRRYQSVYNIVITSDNSNEVILIYHTLRALLISLIRSLSEAGLQNIAFGGQDVQLYGGIVPKNIYMRAITVSLQYETSALSIFPQPLFNNLIANGVPVNG